MADHIKIRNIEGTWVVRAGGAVLGETSEALELTEGRYPPVIYIPRKDLAMAFFERTETASTCPHKGQASYYTIKAPHRTIEDAGWSYESPTEGVEMIAGHIAFYPDRATVEQM